MKRFLILFICISVFVSSVSVCAFAQETEQDIPQIPADFEVVTDGIDRFIGVGEQIDISAGYISYFSEDGKPARKALDNSMLQSVPETSAPGYLKVKFTVFEQEFSLSFIVVDESKTIDAFEDVYKEFWGYNAILRCVRAGMFEGRSEKEFAIKGNMTRAEFCQVLYNIYKNDEVMAPVKETVFTDLKAGGWYEKAVNACAAAGIVSGVGEGRFNPDGDITRQDAAVMMMNIIYGEELVAELDYDATLSAAREKGIAANDIDSTSDYAKNSMAAALGVIYEGDDAGNLTPRNNITRSEVASLLSGYFFKGYKDPVVQEPEPEPEPQPKKLVYLSPSNQMSNKYEGLDATEGEQMQIVAEFAKQELEKMGYEVFVADVNTKIKDTNEYGKEYLEDGILTRAEEAEQMGADCYVAIHSNAMGSVVNNGKYQGTTCFYNGNNKGAAELSQSIFDSLSAITPTKDNASKNDIIEKIPYAEVWRPKMANLIVEVEFHDYKPYAQWIVDNTEALGIAIAQGIDNYFKTSGM